MDIDLAIIGMMGKQVEVYVPYKLRKSLVASGWSPIAIATGSPLIGDFELSFESGAAAFYHVGVTEYPNMTDYNQNKFVLYPFSLTASQLFSGSSMIGNFSYAAGDILYIKRVGSVLSYKIGLGSWIATSITSTNTLYAHCVMYNYNLAVKNIKLNNSKPIWTIPSGIVEEAI